MPPAPHPPANRTGKQTSLGNQDLVIGGQALTGAACQDCPGCDRFSYWAQRRRRRNSIQRKPMPHSRPWCTSPPHGCSNLNARLRERLSSIRWPEGRHTCGQSSRRRRRRRRRHNVQQATTVTGRHARRHCFSGGGLWNCRLSGC